ncbi:hypothetical protein OV079_50415 [Nannocystis pusilla]|uniref:Uncharacterized protein n=1 Tax=Nannocystis pusilla TaxID=889268 RepID=A0A9X3F086_9BACT|nr:hypothetical protein [Nannocystis pusilla]MCY1013612.1 hypothetical protein [Nannocystis pusilla]
MFDEEAEIQLGVSRRIRVIRSWGWDARDGRRVTPADAAAVADALLRGSVGTYRFRELVAALVAGGRDPRPALEQLLVDNFVSMELPDTHGKWQGPGVKRLEQPDPALERASRSALTWVSVTVVDGDEPGRSFAGAQFKLRLPDNSVRADALDGAAGVRVEDIETGKCRFELTDVPRAPAP